MGDLVDTVLRQGTVQHEGNGYATSELKALKGVCLRLERLADKVLAAAMVVDLEQLSKPELLQALLARRQAMLQQRPFAAVCSQSPRRPSAHGGKLATVGSLGGMSRPGSCWPVLMRSWL